jgi:hypothetical protein
MNDLTISAPRLRPPYQQSCKNNHFHARRKRFDRTRQIHILSNPIYVHERKNAHSICGLAQPLLRRRQYLLRIRPALQPIRLVLFEPEIDHGLFPAISPPLPTGPNSARPARIFLNLLAKMFKFVLVWPSIYPEEKEFHISVTGIFYGSLPHSARRLSTGFMSAALRA